MTTYQYKARDKFGKLVEGMMGSESEKSVAAKLTQQGYTPVSITTTQGEFNFGNFFDQFQRVKFSDLNMFTRQLYTLQKAGLPLLSSLDAIKEQTTNKFFRNVLTQTTLDIEAGSDFSSALARHPHVFDALYISMVRSGEASGKLSETLDRLATFGEHEEQLRLRIRSATRYPLIVVVAMIAGFLALITLVIPRYAEIYGKFAVQLPLPTRFLIGANYVITHYWWAILIFIALLVFIFQKATNTREGLYYWDKLKLKFPVFGPLWLKLAMSRFSRITGTLLQSGVPILQILDLAANSVGNAVVSKIILQLKESVNEGKGMAGPMKKSQMFPPIVTQMVSVGEETGKLDELLLHVSDYYDSQIDYTINNLISLIEPLLILVLGCVVLVMALGIFLPMWNLINLFKK